MNDVNKTIMDFSDKELADLVRGSIYLNRAHFGKGSRFLILFAVPYGAEDGTETIQEALESFRELLTADDWGERSFQVYDHALIGDRISTLSYEEVAAEFYADTEGAD